MADCTALQLRLRCRPLPPRSFAHNSPKLAGASRRHKRIQTALRSVGTSLHRPAVGAHSDERAEQSNASTHGTGYGKCTQVYTDTGKPRSIITYTGRRALTWHNHAWLVGGKFRISECWPARTRQLPLQRGGTRCPVRGYGWNSGSATGGDAVRLFNLRPRLPPGISGNVNRTPRRGAPGRMGQLPPPDSAWTAARTAAEVRSRGPAVADLGNRALSEVSCSGRDLRSFGGTPSFIKGAGAYAGCRRRVNLLPQKFACRALYGLSGGVKPSPARG